MIERAKFRFTVKEFGDGTPWIMFERYSEKLKVLENGFLGLDLPEGTTYEKAVKIAEFLNENIDRVLYSCEHMDEIGAWEQNP